MDHSQPVKLILFQNFSNFLTFILGLPFLIPQERGREEAAGAGNGEKGLVIFSSIPEFVGICPLRPPRSVVVPPLAPEDIPGPLVRTHLPALSCVLLQFSSDSQSAATFPDSVALFSLSLFHDVRRPIKGCPAMNGHKVS